MLFADAQNLTATIVTAFFTYMMVLMQSAAIGTLSQSRFFETVMGPPFIFAGFRRFSFRMCHLNVTVRNCFCLIL